MIWAFLTQAEPTISVNGSSITFKKTGDLVVKAGRHYVQESELLLANVKNAQDYITAYSLGQKVFTRFTRLEGIKRLYEQATKIANNATFNPEYGSVVQKNLVNMGNQIRLMCYALYAPAKDEDTSEAQEAAEGYVTPEMEELTFNNQTGQLERYLSAFIRRPNDAFRVEPPVETLRRKIASLGYGDDVTVTYEPKAEVEAEVNSETDQSDSISKEPEVEDQTEMYIGMAGMGKSIEPSIGQAEADIQMLTAKLEV